MLYQLNVTLNEEDYLDFNKFHTFESAHGKKAIRNARFIFLLVTAGLSAVFILLVGLTAFSVIYVALLLLFMLFYMLFFKQVLTRNIKTQIKRLKKTGKLPFDPVSALEFYEDRMVEITASSRTEQDYTVFERICIVKERYILLYKSSVSAVILPITQIKTQLNYKDFVAFLSQICANIEYY